MDEQLIPKNGLTPLTTVKVTIVQFPFIPSSQESSINPAKYPDGMMGKWILGKGGKPYSILNTILEKDEELNQMIFKSFTNSYLEWHNIVINRILDHSIMNDSNIIVFPEYSIYWSNDSIKEKILELSEGRIIVAGIGLAKENGSLRNRFVVVNNKEKYIGYKIAPSPDEIDSNIKGHYSKLVYNLPILLKNGKERKFLFAVLMCSDFLAAGGGRQSIWEKINSELQKMGFKRNDLQSIICPSFSTKIDTFNSYMKKLAIDDHCNVVFVNSSIFGGSKISRPPTVKLRIPSGTTGLSQDKCAIVSLEMNLEYRGGFLKSTPITGESGRRKYPKEKIDIIPLNFGEKKDKILFIHQDNFYERIFKRIGIALNFVTCYLRKMKPNESPNDINMIIKDLKEFQEELLKKIPSNSPIKYYYFETTTFSDIINYWTIENQNIYLQLLRLLKPHLDNDLKVNLEKILEWARKKSFLPEILAYNYLNSEKKSSFEGYTNV